VSTQPKKDYARASRMVEQAPDEDEESTSKPAGEAPRAGIEQEASTPASHEPDSGAEPPPTVRSAVSAKDAFVTKPVAYAPPEIAGAPPSRRAAPEVATVVHREEPRSTKIVATVKRWFRGSRSS
jgi:hypothetical protein